MGARWWRRGKRPSPEAGIRQPDRVPTPPPATPAPEPGGGFFRRPNVVLTAQQTRVWDLIERWDPPYPDPVGVLTLLERLADDRSPDRPVALVDLGRARHGPGAARLLGYPGSAAPDAQTAAVPPFVLLVALDAEPPAAPPTLTVLTPDLGAAVLDASLSGGAPLPPPGKVCIVHRMPGTTDVVTTGWAVHVLADVAPALGERLTEVLGRPAEDPEAADLAQTMLSLGEGPPAGGAPMPPPAPPAPPVQFPAPAILGDVPPPLPGTVPGMSRSVPAPDPGLRDLAAEGLAELFGPATGAGSPRRQDVDGAPASRWAARLVCSPPPDWAVARTLTLDAHGRWVRGPQPSMLLEDGVCRVVAALLDVRSLPAAGTLHPPLSRLRMLHERLVPPTGAVPAEARWSTLLGGPAILDELVGYGTGVPAVVSLASDTSMAPDDSLADSTPGAGGPAPVLAVVAGTAAAPRAGLLDHVEPLAAMLRQPPGPISSVPPTWVVPAGWTGTEELQVSTETYLARIRLETLGPGATLDTWEDELYRRAPYLRDYRELGVRDVTVDGLAAARLRRFDWQPSGRGRLLTTVCVGVTADDVPAGLSMITEVGLEDGELDVQPDEILGWLRVLQQPGPTA